MAQPDNTSTAYVIPKRLWDRVYAEWKAQKDTQTGGTVVGTTSQGVDPSALLHALAVNASLEQSPKMAFVKHADQAIKKILDDPTLSTDGKVRALEEFTAAYRSQRTRAQSVAPASTAAAAAPAPAAVPSTAPPVVSPAVPSTWASATPGPSGLPTPAESGARPKTPKTSKTTKKRNLPETPRSAAPTPLVSTPVKKKTTVVERLQAEIDALNNLRHLTPEQKQLKKQLQDRRRNMFRTRRPVDRLSP